MKLHGNRVYLNLPAIKESAVILTSEQKKQLEEERFKEFDRLTVFAVSTEVKHIQSNDEVLVSPEGLKRGIFIEIDGNKKICVSSFDIMHTW
jgi:hypothetical protein